MRMWELRRNGVASEPIAESDVEAMLAAGEVEGSVACRPVGKDAWKPALRYPPFAEAARRAKRGRSAPPGSVEPPPFPSEPPKDPLRWDQQTQLNMPVPMLMPQPPPEPPRMAGGPAVGPAVLPAAVPAAVATRPPAAPSPGFTAGLFDLSFTHFVTTRVVKVLYVLFLIGVALGFVGGLMAGITAMLAAAATKSDAAMVLGLGQLALTPIVAILVTILGRMAFEGIVVFFRMAEHLAAMERRQGS